MNIKENSRIKKLYNICTNIGNNKYFNALKKIMLFSAVVHIIMIALYSFTKLNTVKFNFFDILDLDLFFPKIIIGNISQITSVITFFMLYGLIVMVITLRRKRT